jgi:hypothetical protein
MSFDPDRTISENWMEFLARLNPINRLIAGLLVTPFIETIESMDSTIDGLHHALQACVDELGYDEVRDAIASQGMDPEDFGFTDDTIDITEYEVLSVETAQKEDAAPPLMICGDRLDEADARLAEEFADTDPQGWWRNEFFDHLPGITDIYVRALDLRSGEFKSVDIYYLDAPSLRAWLRSRGGDNQWAESVVFILLGRADDFEKTSP